VSARKREASTRRGRLTRSKARELRKVLPSEKALAVGMATAEALFQQIRSERRRPRKPVTLKQVLRSVVMILVMHLTGFDYRKEQASVRARTARMLAALTVVLTDTVRSAGTETPLNNNRRR